MYFFYMGNVKIPFFCLDLAYLAMGGDEEKKKGIDRQKLISLIKDEFNLTIDIQVNYSSIYL